MYDSWESEAKTSRPLGDWSDVYKFADKLLREKGLK